MWLWVLCAELVFVVPLLFRGAKKDSVGECFNCVVLRSMNIGLWVLTVTCAINELWLTAARLFVLFSLAVMVEVYFQRVYRFTEEGTENIHYLDLNPSASFQLQHDTSMLMARMGCAMACICAIGYTLCYRRLGLGVVLSIVAGYVSGLVQFIMLTLVSMRLFSRRVNAARAALRA
jgi:hypothetical protein